MTGPARGALVGQALAGSRRRESLSAARARSGVTQAVRGGFGLPGQGPKGMGGHSRAKKSEWPQGQVTTSEPQVGV